MMTPELKQLRAEVAEERFVWADIRMAYEQLRAVEAEEMEVADGIRRRSFEMILHYLGRAKSTAAWWRSGWTYLFPVAFSTGDWDQIPHFDEVADAIAACYPQVNWGEDVCDTLYEILKKDRVKKVPALEMYRRAFDLCLLLRGSVLDGTYVPEKGSGSDEVPF